MSVLAAECTITTGTLVLVVVEATTTTTTGRQTYFVGELEI